MYAVRNIRLCTKDCLCLYVCPTGATDTETGQVDVEKCTGCGACVNSCPSHALSMMPEEYPPQQPKTDDVKIALLELAGSKVEQENVAYYISKTTDNPVIRQLADAISKSNRLMAEDLLRESGYMLPQSSNVRKLLQNMISAPLAEDFPVKTVEQLLKLLASEKA